MKRTPGLLLTLAIYRKLNRMNPDKQLSDVQVGEILSQMQYATEMMDSEIETDAGLLEMAVQYVLVKESYEAELDREAREYNRIYR